MRLRRVVGCRLSIVDCRLSVVGCRFVGCRLSVVGCRFVGCRLFALRRVLCRRPRSSPSPVPRQRPPEDSQGCERFLRATPGYEAIEIRAASAALDDRRVHSSAADAAQDQETWGPGVARKKRSHPWLSSVAANAAHAVLTLPNGRGAQTRVSVPHRLACLRDINSIGNKGRLMWRHIGLRVCAASTRLATKADRCGTDTPVCAGESWAASKRSRRQPTTRRSRNKHSPNSF